MYLPGYFGKRGGVMSRPFIKFSLLQTILQLIRAGVMDRPTFYEERNG
jgi:hypothetical protein